jgi:hypothetical protein
VKELNVFNHNRMSLKEKLDWAIVPILGGPVKGAWFGLFTASVFCGGPMARTRRRRLRNYYEAAM